jgi:pyrroline-5-carboxylate reductase
MLQLGFIGGGAMGSALLKGILAKKLYTGPEIGLVEPDINKAEKLRDRYAVELYPDAAKLAKDCRTIILAVKPKLVKEVILAMAGKIKKDHLLISIAAGVSLNQLEQQLPEARFVRVMPNTPARIGRAVSAIAPGKASEAIDLEKTTVIMECVGSVIRVPEEHFDAVTALSGSGPAYVFTFLGALVDAAVMLGLSRDDAMTLVIETVIGSAELLKQSGEHPARLIDEVTSPGGTTAAGLFELEKGGFKSAIMKAVLAAAQRSRELGRLND